MESAYQINIKSSKEKKLVEKTLKKNEYLNFDLTLSHPVTIKVLIYLILVQKNILEFQKIIENFH